eukprot:CAMPEP_0185844678 /NCGR_PEP_ID=MMETSP1354-20130828/803_1 /TAXON_ID=708628 /ORGANISM="Erythrolobus madagascarensis, Strain CCMP3276" /LENGTH=82 /DNA_ID=CAMNT_0028544421 /DNA_START=48 /DNA_END=292 /DNA_ORIENTATION=+
MSSIDRARSTRGTLLCEPAAHDGTATLVNVEEAPMIRLAGMSVQVFQRAGAREALARRDSSESQQKLKVELGARENLNALKT